MVKFIDLYLPKIQLCFTSLPRSNHWVLRLLVSDIKRLYHLCKPIRLWYDMVSHWGKHCWILQCLCSPLVGCLQANMRSSKINMDVKTTCLACNCHDILRLYWQSVQYSKSHGIHIASVSKLGPTTESPSCHLVETMPRMRQWGTMIGPPADVAG